MKNQFTKKAWISGIIIIGSFIITVGVLYYLSGQIEANSVIISTDRAGVAAQDTALSSLATLKSQAPAAAGYVDEINQAVPDQYNIVNFSSWITQAGQKFNVSVSATLSNNGQPITQPTASSPGSAAFAFTAQGAAGNMAIFLKYIESPGTGFPLTLTSFDYTFDSSGEKVSAQGSLFFR